MLYKIYLLFDILGQGYLISGWL